MQYTHKSARTGAYACRRAGAAYACALALAAPAAQAQAQQPAPAPTPTPRAAAAPATLQVQSFEIVGNTLLPAEQIQQRLAEFKGTSTVQRLRDAAAAVQELYRRAGYGGVVAFLPEQTPAGGLIRIRVVEGKLTRIEVTGHKQFSETNVRASLPALVIGRTPEVRVIDAQIQIANESPAKSVQVLLQPGADPGSVAARVTVTEQPVQRFNARVDNTGSERTGRWRAAAGWQHANVLGLDHVFSAEAQTAPEKPSAVAVLSAGYRAPLYARSMAIDAYAAWSDVDGGKGTSSAGGVGGTPTVQFSGRGTIAGLRGSAYLPRWQNVDQRAAVGVESRTYLNTCSLVDFAGGSCGSAGASVAVQPLTLSYTAQTVGELRLSGSVALVQGLGLGGAHGAQADFEAARAGSQRRYRALRLNASAAQSVQDWGVASVRVAAQYSRQPLVPGEQFGLGGVQSVRGFEERELSGDSGLQVSVEFLGPNMAETLLGAALAADADLRGLLFSDAGYVANLRGDPCLADTSHCRMGALGLGLRAQWRQLQLRLDLARAMSTASTTRKGDGRLHVGAAYNF